MGFNTALIVDDSKLARIALKRKLEQRGLQIVMAEDARQALDLLQNTPIDIVFMDHLMPEMDGFEATQEIKGNTATAHLPVIMCSGKEKQGYLEEARAIGASNVLPKPAESSAIEAVFAELEQAGSASSASTAETTSTAVAAARDETALSSLVQPMVERLAAMAEQFDALAQHTDERFVTVADTLQVLSENDASRSSLDIETLQMEWDAKLEQRIGGLALPDTEVLKEQLAEILSNSLQRQVESKLGEVTIAAEQFQAEADQVSTRLKAEMGLWQGEAEERIKQHLADLVAQSSKQLDEHIDRAMEQHNAALRAEMEQRLAALSGPGGKPELDLDGLRSSLKAELIEELRAELPDPAAAIDANTLTDTLKSEVLQQLRTEMPDSASVQQSDIDALRESLKTELLEQLEPGQQLEATDQASAADIAGLRQSVAAEVLRQLQSNDPAMVASDAVAADGTVESSTGEEHQHSDSAGDPTAMVSETSQLRHEFKVLKMLGLISSLAAATSIALHWL